MAGIGEKVEAVELGLILLIVGGVGYGVYRAYKYLEFHYGPGTPDPGGGEPAKTLWGGLTNAFLEFGRSSLSMEGAIVQTAKNPYDVISSIIGNPPVVTQEMSDVGVYVAP